LTSSEERWQSDGIQVGGVRSARGVLGYWFDKYVLYSIYKEMLRYNAGISIYMALLVPLPSGRPTMGSKKRGLLGVTAQ